MTSPFGRAPKAIRAAGEELLGLLVDDWVLFFGTVAALAAAALLASATTGDKTAVGVLLFAGIWLGLFASLARSVEAHRKQLASKSGDRVG
ncbi:MAG: hypothetical protein ABR549_01090 [Mycobacteriales bacterium]